MDQEEVKAIMILMGYVVTEEYKGMSKWSVDKGDAHMMYFPDKDVYAYTRSVDDGYVDYVGDEVHKCLENLV